MTLAACLGFIALVTVVSRGYLAVLQATMVRAVHVLLWFWRSFFGQPWRGLGGQDQLPQAVVVGLVLELQAAQETIPPQFCVQGHLL